MTFAIKVALLGHVSVGKTTLLNALLGEKFSEVSKGRTTAGITHFYVSPLPKAGENLEVEESNDLINRDHSYSASAALKKITNDNLNLRKQSKIHECKLNVEVDKPLVSMLPSTNLVITEIPGINEAGTSDMYLDFVKKSWDTFDCAIIVMDASQGVNTDEQVRLLQFVKTNIKEKKDIPVIILCNKVDDSDDEELTTLVEEVRSKVENIFEVTDRGAALLCALGHDDSTCKNATPPVLSPAFLSLSAHNAFVYRAASGLKRNELQKLGKACIDKIGHEEVGKFEWKRLSTEQQYDIVYGAVNDGGEYEERLASSNFDKFLMVLEKFIGSDVQGDLIEKQLSIEVKRLAPEAGFAARMQTIFNKCAVLDKSTSYLNTVFWNIYSQYQKSAIEEFRSDYSNLHLLYGPMNELEEYACGLHIKLFQGICDDNAKKDKKKILKAMMSLIVQQYETVIEKEAAETPKALQKDSSHNHHDKFCRDEENYDPNIEVPLQPYETETMKDPEAGKYAPHWRWDNGVKMRSTKAGVEDFSPLLVERDWDLSPRDWNNIISMLLMMRCNPHFCTNFGREISSLEWCTKVSKRFVNPSDMKFHITIPIHGPSDPAHWGHLSWRYLCYVGKESSTTDW